MSITSNMLPDIIIDEILSDLDYSNQVKLRCCSRRINQLLKYKLFTSLSVPEDKNDFKDIAFQIGKYVKQLEGNIFKEFFEFKDQFPNLEDIEVDECKSGGVFDQLHSLDIKLKSLTLAMYEPFPTQLQFNFNHIIKSLQFLDISLSNECSRRLDVLGMVQIPRLKILKLKACLFPEDTLAIINRNFPVLEDLTLDTNSLIIGYYDLNTVFTPITFLKLKNLKLLWLEIRNCRQILNQSFPQLNFLEVRYLDPDTKFDIKIITPFCKSLLGLSIPLQDFSRDDVLNLQNLEDADLELCESFDAESMQHLLSLPKLSKLNINEIISDDLFENVTCKSPLYDLSLDGSGVLSHHFLKFLQFNAPSLTDLCLGNEIDEHVIGVNAFSELSGQTSLNLLYLMIFKRAQKFENWVKAQSPNVEITCLDCDT